jgi:hypothetical protein
MNQNGENGDVDNLERSPEQNWGMKVRFRSTPQHLEQSNNLCSGINASYVNPNSDIRF